MSARLLILAILLAVSKPYAPDFQNVAKRAGLTDVFPNGGTVSKQYIIETTGSGIAFIDYDNDGLLDLFVLSGEGGTNRMYHNEGHVGAFAMRRTSLAYGLPVGRRAFARAITITMASPIYSSLTGAGIVCIRNVQGRRFVDVTFAAHLTARPRSL